MPPSASRCSIPASTSCWPDGVSYHGHAVSGGKKKGSGPLGLKRELRELANQVQAKQAAVNETAAASEDLEREIAQLTEELESLRGLQQSHERDALALDHESRKLKEEHAAFLLASVGGAPGTGPLAQRKRTGPQPAGTQPAPGRGKRGRAQNSGRSAGAVPRRSGRTADRLGQADRRAF